MSDNSTAFKTNFERNIKRRRAFSLPKYKSLADVCGGDFDGEYVTPIQIRSDSESGVCLVTHYWFDVESFEKCHPERYQRLKECGYADWVTFNKVLDIALDQIRMNREDIYVTQAFHLLPPNQQKKPSTEEVWKSFEAITQHEVKGRKVVALGDPARYACEHACKKFGDEFFKIFSSTINPSTRKAGMSNDYKATEIAKAIRRVL